MPGFVSGPPYLRFSDCEFADTIPSLPERHNLERCNHIMCLRVILENIRAAVNVPRLMSGPSRRRAPWSAAIATPRMRGSREEENDDLAGRQAMPNLPLP